MQAVFSFFCFFFHLFLLMILLIPTSLLDDQCLSSTDMEANKCIVCCEYYVHKKNSRAFIIQLPISLSQNPQNTSFTKQNGWATPTIQHTVRTAANSHMVLKDLQFGRQK